MEKTKKNLLFLLTILFIVCISFFNLQIKTAYAASSYESESNDTYQTANEISLGNAVYGNLHKRGDVDWYKFTIPENGYISIDFNHEQISSTKVYWTFEVYQSDGVTHYDNHYDYWSVVGNDDKSTCQLGVHSGTYYLKVLGTSNYYSDKTYNITINYNEADNWESEVNNSPDNANEISLNSAYYGSIRSGDDVDWYKFTIPEDGYISIDFNHEQISSKDNYWRFYLYHSDGVTHYDNHYSYWGVTGNENRSTCQLGVKSNTYYLMIRDGYYGDFSDKTYNITINYNEADNWESEVNNTSDKANEISLNTAYYGSLRSGDDVDWYKFTIPEDGYISIDFNHEQISSKDNYWRFYLYHSDGVTHYDNHYSYWGVTGNENRSTCQLGVKSNTYYLMIRDGYYGDFSDKTYNIIINYEEADNWESEVNNTSDKANEISLNTAYYGSLKSSSDVDWYKFTVPTNCKISVSFNHTKLNSSDTYWLVYVYQSDAVTKLTNFSVKGNADAASDYIDADKGTYYLKVYCSTSYSHSGSTYSIVVTEQHDHAGTWEKTTPPTCTVDGVETRVCTICGTSETHAVTALGHTRNNGRIIKKTTIFQVGEIEYTCTVCGEKEIVKDKSKVWVLPVIIVGAVLVVIGLINYVKMMKKKN